MVTTFSKLLKLSYEVFIIFTQDNAKLSKIKSIQDIEKPKKPNK